MGVCVCVCPSGWRRRVVRRRGELAQPRPRGRGPSLPAPPRRRQRGRRDHPAPRSTELAGTIKALPWHRGRSTLLERGWPSQLS